MNSFGTPIACLFVLAVSCAGASDKWWGSVDASFKYRPDDHSTVVHEVLPTSRAGKAGLEVGDLMLAVDGQDLTRASLDGVLVAMRGPVGSLAVLTVKRGSEIRELTVERTPRDAPAEGKD
jgi:C-terminal processing protease CtpA/Prc